MRERQRCQKCGRFFSDPNPHSEYCGYACWADVEAEKDRREGRKPLRIATNE